MLKRREGEDTEDDTSSHHRHHNHHLHRRHSHRHHSKQHQEGDEEEEEKEKEESRTIEEEEDDDDDDEDAGKENCTKKSQLKVIPLPLEEKHDTANNTDKEESLTERLTTPRLALSSSEMCSTETFGRDTDSIETVIQLNVRGRGPGTETAAVAAASPSNNSQNSSTPSVTRAEMPEGGSGSTGKCSNASRTNSNLSNLSDVEYNDEENSADEELNEEHNTAKKEKEVGKKPSEEEEEEGEDDEEASATVTTTTSTAEDNNKKKKKKNKKKDKKRKSKKGTSKEGDTEEEGGEICKDDDDKSKSKKKKKKQCEEDNIKAITPTKNSATESDATTTAITATSKAKKQKKKKKKEKEKEKNQFERDTSPNTCASELRQLPQPNTIRGIWHAQHVLSRHTFSGKGPRGEAIIIKELSAWDMSAAELPYIATRYTALTRMSQHPCVAASYDLCERRGQHLLYTVSEYAPGVSLAEAVRTRGPFSETATAACVAQVAAGLQHLHAAGFLHGNLHSGNVVVDPPTGECRIVDVPLYALAENPADFAVRGAPECMAPEVVAGAPGRVWQSDVWALGCLCVELLTAARPECSGIPLLATILAGSPPLAVPPASVLSPECKEFLDLCFSKDFGMRPTVSTLLAHPFITRCSTKADLNATGEPSPQSLAARFAAELPPLTSPSAEDTNETNWHKNVTVYATGEAEDNEKQCRGEGAIAELRAATESVLGELRNRRFRGISNSLLGCCGAQEDLLRSTEALHKYSKTALQNAEAKRMHIAKTTALDTKKKNADYEHVAQKLSVMRENVSFFEDAIAARQKTKIDNNNTSSNSNSNSTTPDALPLAKLVYGKVTLEAILTAGKEDGTMSGLLNTRRVNETKWRSRFLVVSNNFVFFFKSESPSAAPRRAFKLLGQQPWATRTADSSDSDSKVACFTLSGTGFIFAAPTTSKAEEWVARINAGTRWTEVPEDVKSRGHRIPVLGVPAPALAERDPSEEDPWLPAFLNVLVKAVMEKGLKMEGILRISGSKTEMDTLKDRFETTYRAADVDLSAVDVRNIGGLMKTWLRELPPLINLRGERTIEAHIKDNPCVTSKEQVQTFMKTLAPYCNASSFAVFMCLSKLVKAIAANKDANKMSLDNVYTCLGPSFASTLDLRLLNYFVTNYEPLSGFLLSHTNK